MTQSLVYVNDDVITDKSLPSIKEAFLRIDIEVCKLRLCINESKTNIFSLRRKSHQHFVFHDLCLTLSQIFIISAQPLIKTLMRKREWGNIMAEACYIFLRILKHNCTTKCWYLKDPNQTSCDIHQ